MGWILLDHGDAARARDLLREAANRDPADTEIRYQYAVALAKTGDKAQARLEVKKILDSGGKLPDGADIGTLLE